MGLNVKKDFSIELFLWFVRISLLASFVFVLLLAKISIAFASISDNPTFVRAKPENSSKYKMVPYMDSTSYIPSHIEIDSDKNIYMSDFALDAVYKQDMNELISIWLNDGTTPGLVRTPTGMWVDGGDNLYVVDSINISSRVQKFDKEGNNLLSIGGMAGSGDGILNMPSDVTSDSNGYIFVCDRGNNRIQKFDTNGNYILKWGNLGSGNGQFNSAKSIVVDSHGDIYVLDDGNDRVQKFDNMGNYILQWTSYGVDLAVDSNDYIYIADNVNKIVKKYSNIGDFINNIGNNGYAGNGSFASVSAVATGPNDELYVSSQTEGIIQVFASNGAFMMQYGHFLAGADDGLFLSPRDLAIDSNNRLHITDSSYLGFMGETGNHRVQVIDNNYEFIAKWGGMGSSNGQFGNPWGIEISNDGHIFVVDRDNNRIQKFSSNGNFLLSWGSSGSANGQFNQPHGISIDNENGFVYIADRMNNRIQKFDLNGNYINKWGSSGSGDGEFNAIIDICIDSDGNIYVLEFGNHRIQKFNPNGVFISKWGSNGNGDGQFNYPRGISIDAVNELIYVADTNNHRIQKFDLLGSFISKWGSMGTSDGKMRFPGGVTVDKLGNIHVLDTSNHRIQYFAYDNYAPSITFGMNNNSYFNNIPIIKGIVSDTATVSGNVANLEYKIGLYGAWTHCQADDNVFDETIENYSCHLQPELMDGVYQIFLRASDDDGNITSSGQEASYIFTLDRVPPIAIITNELINSSTLDKKIKITINQGSGSNDIYEFMISNNSTFSGATWEPYTNSVNWFLSDGYGEKVIHLKMRDRAGNVSGVYSINVNYVSLPEAGIVIVSYVVLNILVSIFILSLLGLTIVTKRK